MRISSIVICVDSQEGAYINHYIHVGSLICNKWQYLVIMGV